MNINAIIGEYELQTHWLLNALENISEEESKVQFAENLHPIKWIAGHLTNARITILGIAAGTQPNSHYQQIFGKSSPNKIEASAPTIEQIKADWQTISAELLSALRNIPEGKLLTKAPFQTSIPDETLLGLVAYFAIHESFHIGQISIVRKLIGKDAMTMGRRQNA